MSAKCEPAGMPDARYSARLEYCGYGRPRLVVRFCGEWINIARDGEHARALAESHHAALLQAAGVAP